MFATYKTQDNQYYFGFDNGNGTVLLYLWDNTQQLVDLKTLSNARTISISIVTINRLTARTALLKQSFFEILDRAIETNKGLSDITANLDISRKLFYAILEHFEQKEKWSAYTRQKTVMLKKQFGTTLNFSYKAGKNREIQPIQIQR
jgi:hypothetical protein